MKPENGLIVHLNEWNLYHLKAEEDEQQTRTQRLMHQERANAYSRVLQWIGANTQWDEHEAFREGQAEGLVA